METSTHPFVVLDPTAESIPAARLVAERPSSLNGKRIGLLSNGKRNSMQLLEAVLDLLSAQEGRFSSVVRCDKGNPSRPAPREMTDRLVRDCDFVLTATGD